MYPEYKDLDDKKLADTIYVKAGMPRTHPHPWVRLAKTTLLASGGPLAVLILGRSLIWAFSGFADRP